MFGEGLGRLGSGKGWKQWLVLVVMIFHRDIYLSYFSLYFFMYIFCFFLFFHSSFPGSIVSQLFSPILQGSIKDRGQQSHFLLRIKLGSGPKMAQNNVQKPDSRKLVHAKMNR